MRLCWCAVHRCSPKQAHTVLLSACRWGTQQLEAGLGGSRALQKDLAVAVANAYCDAAEKVGGMAPHQLPAGSACGSL